MYNFTNVEYIKTLYNDMDMYKLQSSVYELYSTLYSEVETYLTPSTIDIIHKFMSDHIVGIVCVISLLLLVIQRVSLDNKIEVMKKELGNEQEKNRILTSANNLYRRVRDMLNDRKTKLEKNITNMRARQSELEEKVNELQHKLDEHRRITPAYDELSVLRYKTDMETGVNMAINALCTSRSKCAKEALDILRNLIDKADETSIIGGHRKRPRRIISAPIKVEIDCTVSSDSDENDDE
jgi:ABC-type multidrug transport system fused ATPase/permease subunit